MSGLIFEYGQKEIEYLKRRDQKLAAAMEQIGMIRRAVMPDLFTALVHTIVGQQISVKAHETVWKRVQAILPVMTPELVAEMALEDLQKAGISFRKATYVQGVAEQMLSRRLDFDHLYEMSDEAVCVELSKLRGIGVWSAQMLMIFSMQRPNILSYDDLAIQRGLRMLYHHRRLGEANFKKYWRRYTPYASVASLYLWEIAGGAIAGMKDYAVRAKK